MPPRKKKIQEITPKGVIVQALRLIWLRSVERRKALKRDSNTCSCGVKASVAKGKEVKVEVHHIRGNGKDEINWDKIIEVIRKELLCDVEHLITLCKSCHSKIHGKKEKK